MGQIRAAFLHLYEKPIRRQWHASGTSLLVVIFQKTQPRRVRATQDEGRICQLLQDGFRGSRHSLRQFD